MFKKAYYVLRTILDAAGNIELMIHTPLSELPLQLVKVKYTPENK